MISRDLKDHTEHAYWLGNEWPLDVRMFQRSCASGSPAARRYRVGHAPSGHELRAQGSLDMLR